MNHAKFQSVALAVLTCAVIGLGVLIWVQNIEIGNLSSAIVTLSRSGSVRAEPPSAPPAPVPAPAPAP